VHSVADREHLATCAECQETFERELLAGALADYVPSELVVARVLRAAPRRPAPLRFVPFDDRAAVSAEGLGRRAASFAAAAWGLSPAPLAAATVTHVVLFAATSAWIFGAVRTGSAPAPRAAPVTPDERIVYVDPTVKPTVTTARRLPLRVAPRPEPKLDVGASGERPRQGAEPSLTSTPQGVEAAMRIINHTFLFEGGNAELRNAERPWLERTGRLLQLDPKLRILIEPERVAWPDSLEAPGYSQRETEVLVRFLRERGMREGQWVVRTETELVSPCAAGERACVEARSRVRLSVIVPEEFRRR
jgi:hypothetical protein